MTNLKADEEAVDGIPSIQVILLSFSDPTNNGAGHHNVVFAERQINALIRQARRDELKELQLSDLPDHVKDQNWRVYIEARLEELHNGKEK